MGKLRHRSGAPWAIGLGPFLITSSTMHALAGTMWSSTRGVPGTLKSGALGKRSESRIRIRLDSSVFWALILVEERRPNQATAHLIISGTAWSRRALTARCTRAMIQSPGRMAATRSNSAESTCGTVSPYSIPGTAVNWVEWFSVPTSPRRLPRPQGRTPVKEWRTSFSAYPLHLGAASVAAAGNRRQVFFLDTGRILGGYRTA